MPSHLPSLASLLLGILLVAPLLRFARGLAEPICAGDLDTRASERWASIRVAESPDHAALYSDWPTSRTSPGRIDTHQHYIPQFYADYLEKYSAAPVTAISTSLLTVMSTRAIAYPESTLGLNRHLTHATCR